MPSNSGSLAARVAAAGRRCSLTGSLLVDWGTRGTPRQVEYLAEYLEAECASRDASRRAQLLRRCAPGPSVRAGARPGGADAREVRPATGQDARRLRLGVGRLARLLRT